MLLTSSKAELTNKVIISIGNEIITNYDLDREIKYLNVITVGLINELDNQESKKIAIDSLIKDKIKVKILEINSEKRRLNCSLKRLKQNPWLSIKEKFKVNDIIDTKIVNIVDFGIFVKVYDEIDGMIHISDLDWDESKCLSILSNFKKGEKVSVKILDINIDKERISLSIKHLVNNPILDFILKKPVKSIISGKIISINEKGLAVNISKNINGFIKKTDLAKDKSEQRIDRFAVNETIDSMITSFDEKSKKINLSIKDIEIKRRI